MSNSHSIIHLKNEPHKSGDFKAHHDACKVAIAHIELLIKLAKWADIPTPEMESEIENAILRGVIEKANVELDGK